MLLLTAQQMRDMDRAAMAAGVPSEVLMARAGEAVAACVRRVVAAPGPIGVLLGRGNNGGDGLVAAGVLRAAGYEVRLLTTVVPEQGSADYRREWGRVAGLGLPVFSHERVAEFVAGCGGFIDALYGTGLKADVVGEVAEVVRAVNAAGRPIIAADIPSGLCADTGAVRGSAIRASHTVTFGWPKRGLVLGDGPEYVGELIVVDIGFPADVVSGVNVTERLNGPEEFRAAWPSRPVKSHKGTYGHVLVIAGALGKIGAGYLTSRAALRAGAGLVTYALPQSAYDRFPTEAAEVMVAPVPDDGRGVFTTSSLAALDAWLAGKRAVALGPGLEVDEGQRAVVMHLLSTCRIPIVLDADGLNNIADDAVAILCARPAPTIITPHVGEMARLVQCDIATDPLAVARDFARRSGSWVVLKCHRTIIAAPDSEVVINATGNPGMATAGSGDVLTGIIAGLLAQGMPPREACCAAVWLHGRAGDLAAAAGTQASLLASDLIATLPQAMRAVAEA